MEALILGDTQNVSWRDPNLVNLTCLLKVLLIFTDFHQKNRELDFLII